LKQEISRESLDITLNSLDECTGLDSAEQSKVGIQDDPLLAERPDQRGDWVRGDDAGFIAHGAIHSPIYSIGGRALANSRRASSLGLYGALNFRGSFKIG